MTINALPARDVAFLTALAEFLLASGSDRAADAIYFALGTKEEQICQEATAKMCVREPTPPSNLSAAF